MGESRSLPYVFPLRSQPRPAVQRPDIPTRGLTSSQPNAWTIVTHLSPCCLFLFRSRTPASAPLARPLQPSGHAFILRRYDTGAFSQTTIFKACFPTASEDEEKAECDWVKASGDNSGANGGKTTDAVRLAGSWVVPDVALETAKTYGVVELIQVRACPALRVQSAVPSPTVPGTCAEPSLFPCRLSPRLTLTLLRPTASRNVRRRHPSR